MCSRVDSRARYVHGDPTAVGVYLVHVLSRGRMPSEIWLRTECQRFAWSLLVSYTSKK